MGLPMLFILFVTDNECPHDDELYRLAPLSANRLTIFLRKYNAQPVVHDETGEIGHRRLQRRPSWIGTSTFEPTARDTLVFKNAFESYQFTTRSHVSL